MSVVSAKLQEFVLAPTCLESIRMALCTLMDERRKGGRSKLEGLRRQITDLDREIDRAAENFLRAPSEILDLVAQKLTAVKRQRELALTQLRQVEATSDHVDSTREVEGLLARLTRLGADLEAAEPARRREVFRELVDRIELRFAKKPRGKRVECPLESGKIYLRTAEGSTLGCVNRGDRI